MGGRRIVRSFDRAVRAQSFDGLLFPEKLWWRGTSESAPYLEWFKNEKTLLKERLKHSILSMLWTRPTPFYKYKVSWLRESFPVVQKAALFANVRDHHRFFRRRFCKLTLVRVSRAVQSVSGWFFVIEVKHSGVLISRFPLGCNARAENALKINNQSDALALTESEGVALSVWVVFHSLRLSDLREHVTVWSTFRRSSGKSSS